MPLIKSQVVQQHTTEEILQKMWEELQSARQENEELHSQQQTVLSKNDEVEPSMARDKQLMITPQNLEEEFGQWDSETEMPSPFGIKFLPHWPKDPLHPHNEDHTSMTSPDTANQTRKEEAVHFQRLKDLLKWRLYELEW